MFVCSIRQAALDHRSSRSVHRGFEARRGRRPPGGSRHRCSSRSASRPAGLILLTAVSMLALEPLTSPHTAGAAPPTPADRGRIRRIVRWGYQLQARNGAAIDLGRLTASPFDLLVLDSGLGERPLTRAELAQLQHAARPKIVLSYLSVGEAEDYRPYWKSSWRSHPPPFIARENSEWKGNFKVRYWDPAWLELMTAYLDRIIDAGFDGVYLDVIDAFEFFGPGGTMPERPTAAQDMRALVIALAEHARGARGHPGFLVVPQNGANILDGISASLARGYLDAIDAIGAEDTFFTEGERRSHGDAIPRLLRFAREGKPVLAVDYVSGKNAEAFVRLARRRGFIPYVGVRELDRLVPQPEVSTP